MDLSVACPQVSGLTDVGCVRPRNEDSIFYADHPCLSRVLAVVADGMGGHAGGAVASRIAVESLREAWLLAPAPVTAAWLGEAIQQANRRIADKAAVEPGLAGMGTTVVAVVAGEGELHVAHVGDSRAYLCRGSALRQLTLDHSVVQELVNNGTLTEAEAERSPMRHYLSRSLGVEAGVKVDITSLPTLPGDRLLLCSDGLSNLVSPVELETVLAGSDDMARVCEQLLSLALSRGASDNVSVIACMV